MERDSVKIFDHDDAAVLLLTPEEIEPWLPVVNERLADLQERMSAPAERGERFAVPQMMLEFNGEMISPDEAEWLEVGWHLPLPPTAEDLPGLEAAPASESVGIVDVEDGKVITRRMPELAKELQLIEVMENWTQTRLVSWLDRNIPHLLLEQDAFRAYLDGVIAGLQLKYPLGRLVKERFELRRKIEARMSDLEKAERRQAYQQALFGKDSQTKVRVGGDYVFNYDPNNYPRREVCPRSKEFTKHYYEHVGDLDDEANREEFMCVMLIDGQDGVEWWVRNLERQPLHAFWLQTSTDKFYPDFVCKLKNGKILVVEYKGGHLATSDDTKEKERLGNLWAERSEGRCLFLMIRTLQEFDRVIAAAKM